MLSEEASYRVGAEVGPSSRVVQQKMGGWGGGVEWPGQRAGGEVIHSLDSSEFYSHSVTLEWSGVQCSFLPKFVLFCRHHFLMSWPSSFSPTS